MKQIQNANEAKARLVRALRIVLFASVLISFGNALHEFWADGIAKALGMAVLITAIVFVLIGATFLAVLPGAKRYLEASWKRKEQPKE